MITRRQGLLALIALAASARPSLAAGLQGMGVLLLHGKGGLGRNLAPLAGALTGQGAMVAQPQMSWSGGSYLTYDQTMQEVAGHVAGLQGRGAQRTVVVGHSLGANVAVGFAARRPGLAGVVAIAPGHWPDAPEFAVQTSESLAQARAMVAAGRGGERAVFADRNQGEMFQTTATAEAYVSFFDPRGPATFRANAPRVRAPLLWVIGSADRGAQRARGLGPRGARTVTVAADHRDTPRAAVDEVTQWMLAL